MATVNFISYEKQSAGALAGVAGYVSQEEKTWDGSSGQRLLSGQDCSPQFACREFRATRSAWRKDSPVWFYHYTQSFHPDEPVDGPTAHQVAKEFAARAWPDSEVLIATHVDADHTHTHFIVNAVCHKTGKMLRQGPGTLARLRDISDELCRAHGLTTLPPQKPKTQGMTGREYRSAAKGESWKFQTMNAIDRCMRRAATKAEFFHEMERLGYGVRWEPGRKNITYTHPSGKKVRDRKLHEEKYLKERMEHEFNIRQQIIAGGIEAAQLAAGRSDGSRDDDRAPGDSNGNAARAGRDAPHGGGVERVDANAQRTVPPDGDGARLDQEQGSEFAEFHAEGADAAGRGDGGDPDTAGAGSAETGTGWEEERAAFFSALAQYQPAAPVPGLAFSAAGVGSVVGAVVRLGSALEHTQSDVYVTRPHSDRKALRREREKKIAMGHKPDDHEEEQGPNLAL